MTAPEHAGIPVPEREAWYRRAPRQPAALCLHRRFSAFMAADPRSAAIAGVFRSAGIEE
ncbi:hypothetical protein [Pseudoxanthomonas putridarboris]|uniref:Uncharacterized protein n=1 Tax=Pseudoxanthomonas putridarboris TaxID=752605 RepID=A0ABU9IVP4_9GAMM